MIYFMNAYQDSRTAQGIIVRFSGHVFQGHTFRAPRPRVDGSQVLIGRIHNRDEAWKVGAELPQQP